MAKGNIILGYLRGSIGDITFFRAKGQQLSRARNRAPANPRTEPQMAQRSRFANAVKFFRQVDSGFFKYAFEDRKANESDYNAFIRNNIDNSGYIGYQANKLQDWPALGLWQLSKGTLPEITAPFPQPISDVTSMYFDLGVNFTNIQDTISDFSVQLISGAPSIWRSGDIITVVIYRATNKSTLPTIDVELSHNAYCGIIQLRLDVNDNRNMIDFTTLVGEVELCLGYNNDGFCVVPTDSTHLDKFTSDYWGYAVVHSRYTDKGLRVSNTTLASRDFAIAINAMSDSGQYYQDVLADWGATENAILQGGLFTSYSAPLLIGRYNASYDVIALPYVQEVTNAISGNELRLKVANGENLTADMFTMEGRTGNFYVRKSTSVGAPDDTYILSCTFSPSMEVGDTITVKFGGSTIWSFTRIS